MPAFPSTGRVTRAYRVQYDQPIEVKAGDQVRLGDRDAEYPGWIWGISNSGRAGWIPEHFLTIAGEIGTLTRDYSSRELDLEEGHIVIVKEEVLGWGLVEAGGRVGWIPLSHLARSAAPEDLPL